MATAKKVTASKAVAETKEEVTVTVETPNKPNKDGLIGGQPVSPEDYARVIAKHNKK